MQPVEELTIQKFIQLIAVPKFTVNELISY